VDTSSKLALIENWEGYDDFLNPITAEYISTGLKNISYLQTKIVKENFILICNNSNVSLYDGMNKKQEWSLNLSSSLGICPRDYNLEKRSLIAFNDDQSLIFITLLQPFSMVSIGMNDGKIKWKMNFDSNFHDEWYYPCYSNGFIFVHHVSSIGVITKYLESTLVIRGESGKVVGEYKYLKNELIRHPDVPVCGLGMAYFSGNEFMDFFLWSLNPNRMV